MGTPATLTIPKVLAGPYIAGLTPDSVTFWLATSTNVDAGAVKAQCWDPLPSTDLGYVAEPVSLLGQIVSGDDRRTIPVAAANLFITLVTVRLPGGTWPRNRAVAYRVAIDASGWLAPPGGSEALPGNPRPIAGQGRPTDPFPCAWFALDPLDMRWTLLLLHGRTPALWTAAETFFSRLCGGPPPKSRPTQNPSGSNVLANRPTAALMLQTGIATANTDLLGWVQRTILRNSLDELGKQLARYLLMLSPAVWQLADQAGALAGVQQNASPDGIVPVSAGSAKALARIASHAPLYACAASVNPLVKTPQVATTAFALFFNFGNTIASRSGALPPYTQIPIQANFPIPAAAGLKVSMPLPNRLGDNPAGAQSVRPYLAVASEQPLVDPADDDGHVESRLGSYENIFVLGTGAIGSVIVPNGQKDDSEKRTQNSPATTGQPARRLYQLTITDATSRGQAPPLIHKGVTRTWQARTQVYKDGASGAMFVPAPCFGLFTGGGIAGKMGYGFALYRDADNGFGFDVVHQGHRIIPMGSGFAIGNRLVTDPEDPIVIGMTGQHHDIPVANHWNLKGVDILIDGQKVGTTTEKGVVANIALVDGNRRLTIDGPLVLPNPLGPDATNVPVDKPRLWRRREFKLVVAGGRIIKVDNEPVVSDGVRLLIDPVWMKLRSGTHGAARSHALTTILLHRPEGWDARQTLTSWQLPSNLRAADTAAHYVIARDGTVVKTASHQTYVFHGGAGSRWGQPAGVSTTYENVNQMAIGIEISKAHDDTGPYTPAQYEHLLWLLGEYCNYSAPSGSAPPPVSLLPSGVIGHSDVERESRDDPGLNFNFGILEAAGFGLRRALPAEAPSGTPPEDPPLVAPIVPFPDNVSLGNPVRVASSEFRAAMLADLERINTPERFKAVFQIDIANKNAAQISALIASETQKLVGKIGYKLNTAELGISAFRSHIFSGARRTLFAMKASNSNERILLEDKGTLALSTSDPVFTKEAMARLTLLWARLVLNRLTTPSPVQPKQVAVPAAPR